MAVSGLEVPKNPEPVVSARVGYVICTTRGAGGSLLCGALGDTGRAGRPTEWFGDGDVRVQRRGAGNGAGRLDRILEAGSTGNGVFGLMLQWRQVPALMAAFDCDGRQADIDAALAVRFDVRRYIWLRRRNKVAQAISNYRASVPAKWLSGSNLDEPPTLATAATFDADRIEHHLALVEHFDRQWESWLRTSRQRALVVTYEGLCEQYEETLRGACDFIGVGASGFRAPPPRSGPDTDALSWEWEAQFRRLKGIPGDIPALPPQVRVLTEPPSWRPARGAPAAELGEAGGRARSQPAKALAREPGPARETAKVTAYDLSGANDVQLVPAPGRRAWMDAAAEPRASRWLPLTIANQHGWLMLCPHRIEAVWDGGDGCDAMTIRQSGSAAPLAFSLMGSGVLTFVGGLLFRTPEGVNLHVRGPANAPKDGVAPLEAIVEADWSTTTFAMHWKFTRANSPVVFEADEPIAMISPVRRGDLEAFDAEILPIGAEPELAAQLEEGRSAKTGRGAGRRAPGLEVRTKPHQKKLFVSAFDDRRVKTIN